MALKLGYLIMVCWLIYVVYAIHRDNAWNDDNHVAIALCVAFAGLIISPVYFVWVYLLRSIQYIDKQFVFVKTYYYPQLFSIALK